MEVENESRVIRFSDLITDGLVLENINHVEKSFVAQEYRQARQNVKKILDKSKAVWKQEASSGESAGWKQNKSKEVFNLIPFVGGRGTGKTSTMCSFANMLQEYKRENDKNFLYSEECSFVVLDTIDASVLKRQENVMMIILSRMMKYLQGVVDQNRSKGNNRRYFDTPIIHEEELISLYREFENLFKDLIAVEQEKPLPIDGSMIQRLLDLNSSHSLPERFRMLTKMFLQYVGSNNYAYGQGTAEQYLVICLDDIDLYNHPQTKIGAGKSAYTLLEQVYEYLQTAGIIVLATYDYDRLKENCAQYISEKFKGISYPLKQAEAFLEKTILPRYCIYMPRTSIYDYDESRRILIDISDGETGQ